jgi:hypothetical protein
MWAWREDASPHWGWQHRTACRRRARTPLSVPMPSTHSSARRLGALCLATVVLASQPRRVDAQDTSAVDSVAIIAAASAAQQLERGEQWFYARCLECHEVASLANPDFRLKWGGRSVFDLFERIRSTMPENEPGSLTSGTYTSIIAYLMRLNGMPVGTSLLSSDSTALASVRMNFATVPVSPR